MVFRLALAAAAAAGLTSTAPETVRYRVEQQVETRVDLSAFGQGEQVQTQAQVRFVTIGYTDSAGGTVMHAILDSLQADGGLFPVDPAAIDSAAGTIYHGFLDPRAKVQMLSMSKGSTFGSQFQALLQGFHPVMERGASPGARWTDTLTVEMTTTQISSKTRSVRSYVMGPEEARDGAPASRVEVAFHDGQTGTMQTPGGPAELEGTSSGSATFFVSRTGRFLGGNSRSEGDASVSGAFAPSAIPLKLTTTTTITVLR